METAENELLCRVGPETPMGKLLRRYWIPAELSSNVAENNGAPTRLRLLGETFVAFRDGAGVLAVLDDACPHRGASLFMGRTGDGCITCIYHGWKIDTAGRLIETPNMREDHFKERTRVASYPVVEAGGIIWVYLGPEGTCPPRPDYAFVDIDEEHRFALRTVVRSNWLQSLESSLDPAHFGILHADYSPLAPSKSGYGTELRSADAVDSTDLAPVIEAEPTAYGVHFAGLRKVAAGDARAARISVFVGPYLVFVPPHFAVLYTALDDEHTAQIILYFDPNVVVDRDRFRAMSGFFAPGVVVDGVLQAHEHNRFLQNQSTMTESWSGVDGLLLEDMALLAGMATTVDRTKEHLVPSDIAIIKSRRWLIRAAQRLEEGEEPFQLGEAAKGLGPFEGTIEPSTTWRAVSLSVTAEPVADDQAAFS